MDIQKAGNAAKLRRSIPPLGMLVEVVCQEGAEIRPLPFLCCWSNEDGWVIAGTRRKVPCEVIGWRPQTSRI